VTKQSITIVTSAAFGFDVVCIAATYVSVLLDIRYQVWWAGG
jgi:hypothetical protein